MADTGTLFTFKANLKDLIELNNKLDLAKAKMQKLKAANKDYAGAKKEVQELGTAYNKNAKAMQGATKSAEKMNKSGSKLVSTFKSAAVAIAAAFAVRAIVGAVKGIVSSFAEFEAQMSAVKAISGATEEEFANLSAEALKLGSTTVFTATQVAQLQEEFARLGFSTEEIDLATASTLDLAAATGESLANSAQVAGTTLRAFNLDASLTKNVTDVMAASFTTTALNLDRFTQSMKFVAPVARAVGFTLEETTALLGQLANNGLSGSIAGNALKNIMLKLGDANSKLAKKLGGPVVGTEQLAVAMQKLSAQGFSATEAVALLDKRSAPAFLALIKNIDGIQDSVEILNNAEGAVTRMAAIRLDNLTGDMTLLKSASEGLSIALGDKFDTSMRGSIFSLTNFIQSITESESALNGIRTVIQLVGIALVGLTTRFAMLGLNQLRVGIIGLFRSMSMLIPSIRAAAVAQGQLNVAASSNPYVAVATVVATLAAAYFMLGEEMSAAEQKQDRLNKAMSEDIDNVLDYTTNSKKRAEAMRAFKDEFDDVLGLMDIELANEKQLLEIRDLNTAQADRKIELEGLKGKVKALQEVKRLEDEVDKAFVASQQARIDAHNDGTKRLQAQVRMAVQQTIRGRKAKMQEQNDDLAAAKFSINALQTQLNAELAETETYQELKLEGDKTFREKKRKHYDDLLAKFRFMSVTMKKETIKQNEELATELTWVTEYRALVDKELGLTDELLIDAQKNTKNFAASALEVGIDVENSARNIRKANIELTVLEKLLSNLDAPIVNTTGKVKKMATAFNFALNKTKDFSKEMSKLMDDLMQDSFGKAMAQATAGRDEAIKGAQRNLQLIATNITNIETFRNQANQKEIQSLIKTNKSKYDIIKNLSVEDYRLITGGVEALDEALNKKLINQAKYESEVIRLKTRTNQVAAGMLKEEEAKQKTNNAMLLQIESSFQETMRNIKMNAASDAISQNEKVTNLRIQEEHGRGTGIIRIIKENGELRVRTIFGQLKAEKAARETAAMGQIKIITDNETAQTKIIDDNFARRKTARDLAVLQGTLDINKAQAQQIADEKEHQRQLLAVKSGAAIATGEINTATMDANVAAQMQAIQTIAAAYTTAFDAFSTYMSNRWEIEKNVINERRDLETEDLSTELEAKLEALEGNEEAQEDVREHYALIQEANDKKREEELRAIAKKEFIMDKTNKIAQAVINGALALTLISAQTGVFAAAAMPIMATLIAAQIAAISATKFTGALGGIVPQFADGGMVNGPSHANGGVKFAVGGSVAELEGGEAVINKRSTAMFRGQLSDMNAAGGGVRFANGGVTPGTANKMQSSSNNQSVQFEALARNIVGGINNKTVTVSEVDITGSQESVSISELTATIF